MGRAERRRAGQKERVKTYTLTDSEIKKIKLEVAETTYKKIMDSMETEIKKQVLENDLEFSSYFDATILWTLHEEFGFGKDRLRRFWDAFILEHKFLRAVYGEEKLPIKFKESLLKIGVDVDEWNRENGLENKIEVVTDDSENNER